MQAVDWIAGTLIAASLCLTEPCVAQSSATQTPEETAELEPVLASRTVKRLDLRPPKIDEVFSQQTIARLLRAARDPDTIEEVEVEASRSKIEPLSPVVPGGILAPLWALLHPTQAWRILAPLPADQADATGNVRFDATDPYRPASLPP